MKKVKIEIPDGKKAEWINNVLTLVDEEKNEKFVYKVLSAEGVFLKGSYTDCDEAEKNKPQGGHVVRVQETGSSFRLKKPSLPKINITAANVKNFINVAILILLMVCTFILLSQ